MDLNTLFMVTFVVVLAIGFCCMGGYCYCTKKKQPPAEAEKS